MLTKDEVNRYCDPHNKRFLIWEKSRKLYGDDKWHCPIRNGGVDWTAVGIFLAGVAFGSAATVLLLSC